MRDTPADDDVVRQWYDWTETEPVVAVVETITAASDPEDQPIGPLYGVLNPDALDSLLRGDPVADLRVSFSARGFLVTLTAEGEVVVRRRSAERAEDSV